MITTKAIRVTVTGCDDARHMDYVTKLEIIDFKPEVCVAQIAGDIETWLSFCAESATAHGKALI